MSLRSGKRDDAEAVTFTQLGPCRIIRSIGAGGAGTVYEARLTEPRPYGRVDKRVAVKVLHRSLGADPEAFARFEREVALGTRIAHPGVVRIFEAGRAAVDGIVRRFLIMEYAEGRTLAAIVADSSAVPEPLVRDIGRQVALGLAAIHQLGVVHRDLKPANILLTNDSEVRILDLGVARLLRGSHTLTGSGNFVGTVLYAAPEQLRGEPLGPHADLYALGVVLYEAATGVQPFDHADVEVVLRRHLDEVPTGAAKLNPRLTPFLEQVLARLLEKAPKQRFVSAAQLATVLEEGERSSWWREVEVARTALSRGRLQRIRIARPTHLVGRRREVAELLTWYADARAGKGRVVWLEGEAGVGKTRLVDGMIAALDEQAAEYHFLYGSHAPATSGGERGPVADAVVGYFGLQALEPLLRRYLNRAPTLANAFAAFLANDSRAGEVPKFDPSVRDALFCQLAKSLAAERPLVWVIEDLHFAGQSDLEVLLALARIAQDRRLLLIATSRIHAEGDSYEVLARLGVLRRMRVERLADHAVEELLAQTLAGRAAADRLSKTIAERSDGNPLFVLALARNLIESDESTTGQPLNVPLSIRELLAERLSKLSDEERVWLQLAAIQGFIFEPDVIARALGKPRLTVLQTLAAIERRTGLVRATGALFEFDHHLLQELLDSEQSPSLRAWHHGLLATAVEQQCAALDRDVDAETATFLATHYLRGERPEDARRFIQLALTHLAQRERGEALVKLATAMLETVPGDDTACPQDYAMRCDLNLARADRLHMLGLRSDERGAIDAALSTARALKDPGRESRALVALGTHLRMTGPLDQARAALEHSLRLAADPATEARASLLLGILLLAVAEFDLCHDSLQRSASLCHAHDDAIGEGDAHRHLGRLALLRNRYAEARAHFEASLRLYRTSGHRAGEGHVLGTIGVLLTLIGEERAATPAFEEQLRLVRETGRRAAEAGALQQLAHNSGRLGQPDAAEAMLTQAVSVARESGTANVELAAVFELARQFMYVGRLDRARELFTGNADKVGALGERRWEASAATDLGILYLSEGRLEEAEERLEHSRALAIERGLPGDALRAVMGLAELAETRGHYDQARALTDEVLGATRELGEQGSAARVAVALGRILLVLQQTDEAVKHLRDAERYAQREQVAYLGVLPSAYLAVAGARPIDVELTPSHTDWIAVQIETHLVLAQVGLPAHRIAARQLLEQIASHLDKATQQTFWRGNRLCRRLAALELADADVTVKR